MAPRVLGRLLWGVLLAGTWSACSRTDEATKTTASATATASSAPPACPAGSHRGAQGCEPDAPAASAEPTASGAPATSGSAEPPPGKCPDPGNPERIGAFDWEKTMHIDTAMAGKLRGLSGGAAEVAAFGTEVDLELRAECSRMAAELGAKGPFTSTEAACQSALDALKAVRGKLGPGAKVRVFSHSPVCLMSTDVAAECTKRCDSRQVEVACGGAQAGKCSGTCEGSCEGRPPGKCAGNCEGSCDGGFTGTCQGICKGTCAGKDMKQGGDCKGKCEGACEGVAKGECKGTCRGGCQLTKAGTCDGQCLGKCSAPIKDPLCPTSVKIPSPDALCGPYCDTRAARKATCTQGLASVSISDAKDAAAAKQYERVVEVNLPVLLRIEQRLKGRLDDINRTRTAVTNGLKELTGSGSGALAQLSPCLFLYDKAVVEGSTRLTAVSRSVAQLTAAAQGRLAGLWSARPGGLVVG